MKKIYSIAMLIGIILLLATESEAGMSNILGLVICVVSGYKLEVFNSVNSTDF